MKTCQILNKHEIHEIHEIHGHPENAKKCAIR